MNYNEKHAQIEDIIDAKRQSGQLDALLNSIKSPAGQPQTVNVRYAYTAPQPAPTPMDETRDEFGAHSNNEGDNNNDVRLLDINNVGPTDSEITLVRVKREGSHCRTHVNNWDMHDKAIPVMPSKQYFKSCKEPKEQEYLVPLSSWEPIEPALCENPTEGEEEEEPKGFIEIMKSPEISSSKTMSGMKSLLQCLIFWKRKNDEEPEQSTSQ